MGTGLGRMIFGSAAKSMHGTGWAKRLAYHHVWRRIPAKLRRKAFYAVSHKAAPSITANAPAIEPIIVVGLMTNTCGLGMGARLCYDALKEMGADVYAIDVTGGLGQDVNMPSFKFRDGSALVGGGTLIVHINAHMLPIVLSTVGRPVVDQKHVVGYWAWEVGKTPPEWVAGTNYCHQIWVTSAFTKRAVEPIGLPGQPISIVHHPVALRDRGAVQRTQSETFRVLSILEMSSCPERKNPIGVVRAFKRAFGDDPGAKLILKVGSYRSRPNDMVDLMLEVGKAKNIDLLFDYLSDDEMRDLYADADCYISLPRSEGFGLTMVEAMLAGLPLVASYWGGHADFLTADNCIMIDGQTVQAVDSQDIYTHTGESWVDPSVDDAAAALVTLRDNPDLRTRMGDSGRAWASKMFSADAYRNSIFGLLGDGAIPITDDVFRSRVTGRTSDGNVVIRTDAGLRLVVDPRDVSLAPHLMRDGYWEQWITKAMTRMIRDDMRIVEIGANIGYYTTLIGSMVHPRGSLVAFEANPKMADIVSRNIAINGLDTTVKLVSKAVAAVTGDVQFGAYDAHMGSSSMYATSDSGTPWNDRVHMITVPCTTLDDHFAHGTKVDLIKIDAEGAEPAIIDGASRVLADNPGIVLIVEHSVAMIEATYGVKRFHDGLALQGFRASVIDHDSSLRPVSWAELATEPHCDVVLRR